ncbi:radical SAM protein, partial [bacterium]|nr:radical SAM protein [bacterium]
IGMQVNSYNLASAVNLARKIRDAMPKAYIVAGGIHPTIFPKETAELPMFDAAVGGEGEIAFPAIMHALKNGEDVGAIQGVATKGRPFGGNAPMIQDLDSIPIPSNDGLPLTHYWSALARSRPVMPMMTSRGCPFKCTFCDRPEVDGGLRLRSIENVIDEIELRQSVGVDEFCFYDDTFTANKRRAMRLCAALAELPRKIRFDCRSRVDTSDDEMFQSLKRAGCDRVYFGVESGDPDILHKIRKYTTPDQVKDAVRAAKRSGLRTLGYFMIGLPDESHDQAQRTIELACELKTDFALIELFIPMPQTEAYSDGLRDGLIKHDYWRAQATDPDPKFVPPAWPGGLLDEGQDLVREAYRRFYMSPSYMVRSLFQIRSYEEFRQKVHGFFRFLKLKASAA